MESKLYSHHRKALRLKLSDLVDELVIDHRKLTEYALDYDAARGKDKALIFEQVLGFTKENHQQLLSQVRAKCFNADAKFYREIEQGTLYQVDVLIDGANKKQAMVRTGWIIGPSERAARLTTIYVTRR